MGCYRFHDLVLDVQPPDLEARADLARLWSELSWDEIAAPPGAGADRLGMCLHERPFTVPPHARRLFATDSFSGFEQDDDFYLSDGESALHLQRGRVDAYLAPSFFLKSRTLQDTFWSFGLARLLRASQLYCLHAAGLVNPSGDGVLVIGASGSGKTTLALALIRQGWRYLSDDAVLLHRGRAEDEDEGAGDAVVALGLRAHLYIDAQAAPIHDDVALGKEIADGTGGRRRRVYLDAEYVDRKVRACVPRVLVFARITGLDHTEVRPVDSVTALKSLLDASGPQLWNARTMGSHLTTLTDLVRQAPAYELRAGLDAYRDSSVLLQRLETMAPGRDRCHALSSN
jgi:hypothetical protein